MDNVMILKEWYVSEERTTYQEGIFIIFNGMPITVRREKFNDSWYYEKSSWTEWKRVENE